MCTSPAGTEGPRSPCSPAAAFPIPGAVLARPAQDSWPGWGEARSCCRRRLRRDVRGLVSRARTRSIPFPPFWLEHAAPTPPPGPRGTDTAVNRGRRRPGQARHAAKAASEEGSTRLSSSPAPGSALAERTSPDSPYQLERRGRTRPAVPELVARSILPALWLRRPQKPRFPRVAPGTARGCSLGLLPGLQQSQVWIYRCGNSPEDAPAVLQHPSLSKNSHLAKI